MQAFRREGAEYGLSELAQPPTGENQVSVYHGCSLLNLPLILEHGLLSTRNKKTVGLSTWVQFVVQRAGEQKMHCPGTGKHIAVITEFKTHVDNIDWKFNEGGSVGLALPCPEPPMDIIHSYSTMSCSRAEDVRYIPPDNMIRFYLVLYEENARNRIEEFNASDF